MKRKLYDSENKCLHVLFIINYFASVDFYLILIRYFAFYRSCKSLIKKTS